MFMSSDWFSCSWLVIGLLNSLKALLSLDNSVVFDGFICINLSRAQLLDVMGLFKQPWHSSNMLCRGLVVVWLR